MSGNLLILIELLLVFGVAFGWGLNELRVLRKYKRTAQQPSRADDEEPATRQ